MLPLKTILLLTVAGSLNLSTAAPDSAGIVEMVNGLAYGGIPYGSVTGMVAKYAGYAGQQINSPQPAAQSSVLNGARPVVVAANYGIAPTLGAQAQSLRIYNIQGVLAPAVARSLNYLGK
nr:uncharacterized protein LOC117225712 [Megalopta genalis]